MTFRKTYRELSESEIAQIARVKDTAAELWVAIESLPDGREKALAKTKVEEAVMWAVKGVTG